MAITLVALSMVIGIVSVRATPETPQTGTPVLSSLLSNILTTVNTVGDDTFSTMDASTMSPPPTQHYGPYLSSSPDSGSCGNDWATDTFDRHFSVFSQDGAIVVVEQFKNFSFVTPASDSPPLVNPSPGACNNGSLYNGGTVANGVTGSAVGYFIIPMPPGQSLSPVSGSNPNCNAVGATGGTNSDCTTTGFINSHFTLMCYPVTCSATTFYDHYTAPKTSTAPNSMLTENEWKDASANRGGMIGDIRSN